MRKPAATGRKRSGGAVPRPRLSLFPGSTGLSLWKAETRAGNGVGARRDVVRRALALSMQDFAAQIIARGRKARLTRSALDEIRQICVLNTKNSHMSGFPIEQEAEVFRQAIDQLEKFMEGAVERGWEM